MGSCTICGSDYSASIILIRDGTQNLICSCGNVDVQLVDANGERKV